MLFVSAGRESRPAGSPCQYIPLDRYVYLSAFARLRRRYMNCPMKTATRPKSRRVRRTQEERSSGTREKLLRSTIEVLLKRGYNGLSLAQVHAHAGLSSGARVHHYKTKADLVIAATEFAYERAIEAGRKLAEKNLNQADPL